MANKYTINFTNPNKGTLELLSGEADGPTNFKRSLDIDLVGMGHALWGEKILENLVHILENFSSPEDPLNPGFPDPLTSIFSSITPTRGQLWYNESKGQIFVFDDIGSPVTWKKVGGMSIGLIPPLNPSEGDLWWDTTVLSPTDPEYNRNLKIFLSGTWNNVIDDYLVRDGSKQMLGHLNMGGNRIENVAQPNSNDDALNLGYADNRYVNVSGDSMSGVLDMGSNNIVNVADPTANSHAINLGYADNRYVNVSGDSMSGVLDMGSNNIVNVADPNNNQDAATKVYVDTLIANIGFPVGTVIATAVDYTSSPAILPQGWLVCDGSAVSRTTYANLFSAIGTTYGPGNGTTTFNLPDYRGYFLRGHDAGAGNDPDSASRLDRGDGIAGDRVGTKQDHALEDHEHEMGANNAVAYAGGNIGARGYLASYITWQTQYTNPRIYRPYNANISPNETRPKNIYVTYLIYAGV